MEDKDFDLTDEDVLVKKNAQDALETEKNTEIATESEADGNSVAGENEVSTETREANVSSEDASEEAILPESEDFIEQAEIKSENEENTIKAATVMPIEISVPLTYFPEEEGEELIPTEEPGMESKSEEQIQIPLPDEKEADEEAEPENEEAEEEQIPTEDNPAKKETKETERVRKIDTVFDFIELFIFTLVAVLILTSFFFRHSIVEGESMTNTLMDKETLIITNFLYTPEQNDIIVFEDYGTGLRKPLVKRVIATEGQTVRVTRNGIMVDGVLLDEDEYVFTDGVDYKYSTTPAANSKLKMLDTFTYRPGEYYEFVVPENELFVLGDHRNESTDSRLLGTVSEDSVLGRVVLRILPLSKFGTVE